MPACGSLQTKLPVSPATPYGVKNGAGGWIRTTEAFASDLQSDPFGHSGTPASMRGAFSTPSAALSTLFSLNFTDLATKLNVEQRRDKMELARGVEPPTG